MNQPPSVPEQAPADARTVAGAQPEVVVVCQRTRWTTVAFGLFYLPFSIPPLVTAHTAALAMAVVLALMNAAILGRAFLVGTVRATGGRVVIRSALRTYRYAAADIVRFEAEPGLLGPRKGLFLAAVTTSGHQRFENFHCPRSGRGSDLVPTTASRLNAYLAAYR